MDKQPTHSFLRSVLLAFGAFASAAMWAQNDLVVHVDGLSNDTVYLAHYYGAKLFYNDTAVADAKGTVTFEGKPFEEGGKYAVVMPGPKFFEFMMVDEPMEFKTTAANPSGDIEVLQSKENEVFYGYLDFIKDKRTARAPFDAVLRDSTATDEAVAEAKAGIAKLTDEVVKWCSALCPRAFGVAASPGCRHISDCALTGLDDQLQAQRLRRELHS